MINHTKSGNNSEISGITVPEFVNLNNIKKNPQTIKVPKIEKEVNLPILKNLLLSEAYAKIKRNKGIIKNGIKS